MDKYRARNLAGPALAGIGLFGLNAMFGQIYRNGYIGRVLDILSSPKPVLPGSQNPLLTSYLGLPVLDGLLAVASVLWANVADGSSPVLSLYALQFGGQLVPIFLVMMVEGSKVGNTGNPLHFSVLWGYTMQTVGYAATMPIYAIMHLFTSPTFISRGRALSKANRPRTSACLTLEALVPAFSIGYLLPTLLMAWPVSSPTLHQWFGVLWQGFPLYVVVWQQVFTRLRKPTLQSDSETISRAYDWAFNTASVIQLFTYTVILAVKVAPGSFPTWAVEEFTFGRVFRPGSFFSTRPLTSMITAMHEFFKWDQIIGSAAALTWAVTLNVTARNDTMSWGDWILLGWDILRWSTLAGPGGALARLLQRRDKIVISEHGQDRTKGS
ncbi:uncharacterized protein BCR38DRAFT_403374 [Pseudomassariella vexata]|uniref:Uncharacterized protein n=1 Tax=Pseudomassariella vexata TaxID=1141098 RepID=A0A1Y2D7S6_9PEZI|nr:uncharacterized protein BCR38DRAFT_403374 [Pseudomassariella vexata]ORY55267.1 hypothetical protein BCR38DRAFT_403374 [Pseudomassariella vexata]